MTLPGKDSDATGRETNSELLIRIDERTQQTQRDLSGLHTKLDMEIKGIRDVMVTRVEFGPVKMVVFGLVGTILLAVLTAVIAQVITRAS